MNRVNFQFRGDELISDVLPIKLLRDLLWERYACGGCPNSSPAWECARQYMQQRDELAKMVTEMSAAQ